MISARAPAQLENDPFDLLVIGGGILGAFLAWDASLRGLKTGLVERDDFGGATTAASGRVLHGGLRSLQHMEPRAAARSLRERDAVARLAPGLCSPLPFLLPVDGGRLETFLFRGAAFAWNGFVRTMPGRVSPPARFVSSGSQLPAEVASLAPCGGLLVHDRQIVSPERLVLAVLAAAEAAGAVICNRLEAEEIIRHGGRVAGVRARDRVSDRTLEIRATYVINAAGPWAPRLWPEESGPRPRIGFARGVHLVVDRTPPPMALGLSWSEQSADGRWGRARRVFVMPWAGITLVGASWLPVGSPPAGIVAADGDEVDEFRQGLDARWPDLGITADRVRYAVAGLYPRFGVDSVPDDRYAVARHPFVHYHGDEIGPVGLITVIGVKLTTARALAERVLDGLAARSGMRWSPCATADAGPLPGARPAPVEGIGFEPIRNPEQARRLAEVAVEREQAGSLADLFLRRSVAGQFGLPARDVLESAATELARALVWTEAQRQAEIRSFAQFYERLGVTSPETEGSV